MLTGGRGSGRGWPLGSGPLSPFLTSPLKPCTHPPAPAMAEVPALPHGEPSVPKEAKMLRRCIVGEKSSLRCRVVFMLPAYHPHSTGRGWASTCQTAQANKALSRSLPGNTHARQCPPFLPFSLSLLKSRAKEKEIGLLGLWGGCVVAGRG